MRLLALTALLLTSLQPTTKPAQIILIRHAEEPADQENPHLSPAGVNRAAKLVDFFLHDAAINRFGRPVAVFATQTTKDGNGQRTQETVAPLAKALGVEVQTPAVSKDFAALAKMILADKSLAGKTVVVCWNHEELPQLAAALGVKPEPPHWKARVFDRVWVISYSGGKARMAESSERLGTQPGDRRGREIDPR